jgi:general stress protein 26
MKRTSTRRRKPSASRPHMPGYGLPSGQKGLLPWSWAERRLKQSHNYFLITVRPDRRPHAMPLWGIWADGRFVFSTGANSRKAKNLARNNRCVVCTEKSAEAVIVEGTAKAISDKRTQQRLAPIYHRKYKPWTLDPKMGTIFEVRPRVAFGMWEKRFRDATRWTF